MSVTFFTDRDLGIQFPALLHAAGLSVERHRDHFRHDTPDDVWLERVASHNWVAVTHDRRIRYKPNELAAVVEHKLRLLVVVGKAPHADLARSFVASIPVISQFIAAHKPPFIGKVYRASAAQLAGNADAPGRVELSYPKT